MQEQVLKFIISVLINSLGDQYTIKQTGSYTNTGHIIVLKGLTTTVKMYYNFQSPYCTLGKDILMYSESNFEALVRTKAESLVKEAKDYKTNNT